MNSVNIIGRIGKEIELKYLPTGSAVASFSIAVNQDYKKQDGTKVEKTSWFDITAFGKTAENVNKFFGKGSMIGIRGELEQQTWQDQQQQNRSKVIIRMMSFTFMDKKQDSQQQPTQQNYNAPQQQQNSGTSNSYEQNIPTIDIDNDEIPF